MLQIALVPKKSFCAFLFLYTATVFLFQNKYVNNKKDVKSERLGAFPTYEGCVVYEQLYHVVQFLVAVVSTPLFFFCSEDCLHNSCTI